MTRSFIKKTTNLGGTIGVIIPKEVCYAEGIKRSSYVRVIIEPVEAPEVPLNGTNALFGISPRDVAGSLLLSA